MRRTRSIGAINPKRTWNPDYGDGSDGSPASSSFTVAKQEYQWVDYTLNNGHTITLSASYKPSIFRVQGTLTINGAINGDGKGFTGGPSNATTGLGPGAGIGGSPSLDKGGGGAGHSVNGSNGGGSGSGWGLGGNAYNALGDILRQAFGDYWVGSGGGCGATSGGGTPGIGGDGGGGLLLIAQKIVLGTTASISIDGTNGATVTVGPAGGGGGGSGGLLILIAGGIELPGSGTVITATKGSAGTGTANGGDGADGRVYLCYMTSITPSDATSRSNPTATAISLKATIGLG